MSDETGFYKTIDINVILILNVRINLFLMARDILSIFDSTGLEYLEKYISNACVPCEFVKINWNRYPFFFIQSARVSRE